MLIRKKNKMLEKLHVYTLIFTKDRNPVPQIFVKIYIKLMNAKSISKYNELSSRNLLIEAIKELKSLFRSILDTYKEYNYIKELLKKIESYTDQEECIFYYVLSVQNPVIQINKIK